MSRFGHRLRLPENSAADRWRRRPSHEAVDEPKWAQFPVRSAEGQSFTVRSVPGGRLSQGLAVDGSIWARLLGLRLLRLDAHITIVPAEPADPSPPTPPPTPGAAVGSVPPRCLDDAVELLARTSQTLDRVGGG